MHIAIAQSAWGDLLLARGRTHQEAVAAVADRVWVSTWDRRQGRTDAARQEEVARHWELLGVWTDAEIPGRIEGIERPRLQLLSTGERV